jgi:hypothetical protein
MVGPYCITMKTKIEDLWKLINEYKVIEREFNIKDSVSLWTDYMDSYLYSQK